MSERGFLPADPVLVAAWFGEDNPQDLARSYGVKAKTLFNGWHRLRRMGMLPKNRRPPRISQGAMSALPRPEAKPKVKKEVMVTALNDAPKVGKKVKDAYDPLLVALEEHHDIDEVKTVDEHWRTHAGYGRDEDNVTVLCSRARAS